MCALNPALTQEKSTSFNNSCNNRSSIFSPCSLEQSNYKETNYKEGVTLGYVRESAELPFVDYSYLALTQYDLFRVKVRYPCLERRKDYQETGTSKSLSIDEFGRKVAQFENKNNL
uniref:Uncharacterized protein n=1 Tax=Romanomermis culicivorax TaxID=13658 RepID=A0A915KHA1_ROMCU